MYRHIRLDKHEPFYIGIGTDTKYTRAHDKLNRSDFWKKIYAISQIEVEIMLDDLSLPEAHEKEKEFIKLYGRKDVGSGSLVNMTDGGEGMLGNIPTTETRIRLSLANKGKVHSIEWVEKVAAKKRGTKHSAETKKRMSLGKIGNTNSKGKSPSVETREKLSKAGMGRKDTPETTLKRSMALKGRIVSLECRKKLSLLNAVFSDEQVREIRGLKGDGLGFVKISKMYGCSEATIRNIIGLKRYKHVE